MSDTFDIDLTGIEASKDGGGWTAFPSGEYRVMITKAEVKDTKAGTGKRLALELTVMSNDELNGRVHWESLNIVNPNEVAQRIAHEHLAMLADASDLKRDFLKTTGVSALQGKVVLAEFAKVYAKDGQLDYADKDGYQNTVRAYCSTSGASGEVKTKQPTSTPVASDDVPF